MEECRRGLEPSYYYGLEIYVKRERERERREGRKEGRPLRWDREERRK